MTPKEWFLLLAEYEGYSSGELAVKFGLDREEIKTQIRYWEIKGFGEFTIGSQGYHFWLNKRGKSLMAVIKSLEIG